MIKSPILRLFGLFFIFLKIFSGYVVLLLYSVWYSRLIKRKTTDKALAPYGDQRYNGIWVSLSDYKMYGGDVVDVTIEFNDKLSFM